MGSDNGVPNNNNYKTTGKSSAGELSQWDDLIPVPKLSAFQSAIVVLTLALLCFMNSVYGDFVFDDNEAVLGNDDLLPETPLHLLFSHDFWGSKLDSSASHKSYRPLTVLTFRLNYILSGGLHPFGFHLTNILLHGVVCVLFLPVFSSLIGGHYMTPGGSTYWVMPRASLLCAILFAVHPVHTESVSGVVGRADLLCALFFNLSFLSYVKACQKDGPELYPEDHSWFWFAVSLSFCAVSVLCKEQGITIIGVCSAYDVIQVCRINIFHVFRKPVEAQPINNNKSSSPCGQSQPIWFRKLLQRHCVLLVFGLILLAVRWKVMGSTPPTFQLVDNPHSFANGTLLRSLNYNYLYSLNGWLLLNPWWLCFDWSMGCVPVINSLTDPRLICVLMFWLVISLLVFSVWKETLHQQQRVVILGLAFVIVPFLPATNLLFRVGFVIAERVLYLSTAGLSILLVTGIQNVTQTFPQHRRVIQCFLVMLIAVMICRSIQRSSEWTNEMSLFSAGTSVCPLNAKVHYNIAKVSADKGLEDVAIKKYRLAIQLNPRYDQALNNLGNLLKERGDNQEALALLSQAVQIRSDFAAAWMNLGIVQAALKQTQSAEESYLTAMRHRKKYPDCMYNLGNLYLDMGRHTDALLAWRNATLQKETHVNSWNNMMILLTNLKRYSEAETVGKAALRLINNSPALHYNLANNYGQAGKYEDSEYHFLKALSIEQNHPGIYANLGVLYHRWGKFDKAEEAYLRAIELEPNQSGPGSTRDNLQKLYKQKEKR